ncbi:MAG: hypothetical protein D6725_14840, partial [Planctomycetota bacterium]
MVAPLDELLKSTVSAGGDDRVAALLRQGNVAAAAEAAVQSERTRWQRRILVLTVTLVFPVVLAVIELFVRYAAGDRPQPVDPTRWLALFTFLAVLQIPAALHCQRRLCRLEIL